MQFKLSVAVGLLSVFVNQSFAVAVQTNATAAVAPAGCKNATLVETTWMGTNNMLRRDLWNCHSDTTSGARLNKRQAQSVCGNRCNEECSGGGGGPAAPNGNDCGILSREITGANNAVYNIGTGQTLTFTWISCSTTFFNSDNHDLTYCPSAWGALVGILSNDCNSAHGSHGGACVAATAFWSVNVAHS